MDLEGAIDELRRGKGNIRCKELIEVLESLGFIVRRAKSGKHYVVKHPDWSGWHGAAFACPHRGGDPVKSGYIDKMIRTFEERQEFLAQQVGEGR